MHNAIEVKGLNKTYDKLVAISNLDFNVAKGDFLALLGPNGAGKSTLIGILGSLIRKNSGIVKINNIDIDINHNKAKSNIGIVMQENNFGFFSKVEDILITQAGYFGISSDIAKKRADQLLDIFYLNDKRNVSANKLSGGMKKRLMIAKAMMHDPDILILDEPSAGVDIEIRRSIWEFLRQINRQGKTIILTTHYLEEAEALARNVIIINKGKIVESGKINQILKKLKSRSIVVEVEDLLNKKLPTYCKIIEENLLEINLIDNICYNKALTDLIKNKINIINIENKQNRLEELFIHLIKK